MRGNGLQLEKVRGNFFKVLVPCLRTGAESLETVACYSSENSLDIFLLVL